MSVLFVLLPLGILLSAGATVAYIWAVKRGQFDDTQTPALRILMDDEEHRRAATTDVKD
ncbi:MAG: cbb3-type cytochrome oxidase assembly protein CcoS [Polyangiaceae bacterium]|nr:cbb3-type cytochrome oxidase assembly protein CcoS [Polyangiaceae bacterium]